MFHDVEHHIAISRVMLKAVYYTTYENKEIHHVIND